MTYNDLLNIFVVSYIEPWKHDYYVAIFDIEKTKQEFLDYAYSTIPNLEGLWYQIQGSTIYFIVPKGTVIPEDFAETVTTITDVPEQPVPVEGNE